MTMTRFPPSFRSGQDLEARSCKPLDPNQLPLTSSHLQSIIQFQCAGVKELKKGMVPLALDVHSMKLDLSLHRKSRLWSRLPVLFP
jgi:hypothetical protein